MSCHIQSTVKKSSGARTSAKKDHALLTEGLYTCLNEHLMILMNQMLNTAGDRLFNLSEKAVSNEKQMIYLDMIRLIKGERTTINNQFFISLNQSLGQKNTNQNTDNSDELSLVEQDEMEEMVAITTIHSQAMNLFGEEVNHLQARLEYLEISGVSIFEKDAIEPKALCEVFKQTLDPLDLSIETKLVFYRLYNDMINIKLGVLYRSLNELCIKAGILPEIVLKTSRVDSFEEEDENISQTVRKAKDVNNPSGYTSSSHAGAGLTSGEASTALNQKKNAGSNTGRSNAGRSNTNRSNANMSTTDRLNTEPNTSSNAGSGATATNTDLSDNSLYAKTNRVVAQFLNGDAIKQGPGIPESFSKIASETAADGKNYYPRKEVMRALSRLQHSLMQEVVEQTNANEDSCTFNAQLIDTKSIKQELLADIGNQNGGMVNKQVNVLDERSIDFVGMMFNVITEDESISGVISNLIMRLQIPVIKVAMLDQNLFTDEKHPAKNVLNLVSDAGKGVTSEEDRVYSEIETIVNHVIETFDIDIGIFEEAVEELEQLIASEDKLVKETERAEQRAIIKAHARDVVVSKLKILSSKKKLPKKIRPLVLKHWASMMLNNYIRHGKDSEQWVQSVLLLKLLLKCMQPIKGKEQYILLKNNHQVLVDAVNEGLYETKQNKEEIDHQIQSLKHLLTKRIDDYSFEQIQTQTDIADSVTDNKVTDNTDTADTTNVVAFHDIREKDSIKSVREETAEEKIFIPIDEDNESLDKEAEEIQKKADLAKEKIARLGSQARPGDWYEVYNGEDKALRRLKLSVILTESAKLIFVDRRGVKVIEKDASEFIDDMENGRSRLIADHSAFDHALGKVINALAA